MLYQIKKKKPASTGSSNTPNQFFCPFFSYRPYNLFEAEGWKFLRDLEKGKYSESDTYVTHEEIPTDRKEVFYIPIIILIIISNYLYN